MKTQTFGLEVEMNRITRQKAAQVVAKALPTNTLGDGARVEHTGGTYDTWTVTGIDGRKWKLMSDASIDGPFEQRTEFVTPVCHYDDI